ncbi:MAG: cytochrome c oxidase assembly protein [Desulfobacteraceae bacterium]|nr:cytochrome c oxidase assembly protein [Desulfobacteraceae bacterium]
MTTIQLFEEAWDLKLSVIIGCAALILAYLWVVRFRLNLKTMFFVAGVVLMLLTLIGPLDFLGDDYLFSAHMLEHILLELAVPPLLLLGLPAEPVESLLSIGFAAKTERFLRRPVVALLLGVGTLWLWHAPVLYNAALNNEGIHAVQHLSMLVTGTIFWWPVFSPLPSSRLLPIAGAVYVFIAMSVDMILGILLTFMPLGFYPKYMRLANGAGIFHFIRTAWKLTPQEDLNLGGMFMWIIGGLFYFTALLVEITRLYWNREERVFGEMVSGRLVRNHDYYIQEKPAGWNVPKPEFIPSPTYWPFVLSLGATLMGLGLLTSMIICVTGLILFIVAIVKWTGDIYDEERQ